MTAQPYRDMAGSDKMGEATLLLMIPRTRILGAILLTGHLGGALASHLRVDNPLFSHTLFPVYVGILMWTSVCLSDERIRSYLLFKKV